ENEATDVLRETVLSWMPGEFADQHDVFFGTNFNDVNEATTIVDPAGVYRGRQSESTYVPDRLDLGQTYYWRVDEVNAAPDYTVFPGNVWQFTAEPVGYPIQNVAVTASSANRAEEGPENTINGSGLDEDGLHSSESADMWLTNMTDPSAAWIQFEFDRSYKLYQMRVWNYNSTVEPAVGFGVKEATVEYSADGTNWSSLGATHEFARGSGAAGYAANTTVDFAGASARYVRITAKSNWGGLLHQFGLSEVRFLYIPVHVREPSPDPGATDVDVNVTLSFRAGREAARHDVYLSTDEQSVIDGTAPVATVTEASYTAPLDLASTYYWRIDEVNDAETPTTWQGDIWNLSTQEFLVVEDFESYNDIEAGEEGSNLIYLTWVDGFDNPAANGSTIGYTVPFEPTMETSTVFDGRQSVPFSYNNTMAPRSEVTANAANLQAVQDWTKHGIKALTVRFYGDPNNSVNDQMYVKINGAKVAYDGDAENLRRVGWQMWYVDLASAGANLSNVTELAIGFERVGAFGGQGLVLLDGIRLYSYDRQLVTPSEPSNTGLVVHWPLDGGAGTTAFDASGNGYDGTFSGNPLWVAGYDSAGALNFDGLSDSVIYRFADETWSTYTTALWAKADVLGQPVNRSMFSNNGTTDGGFQLCFDGSDNYEYHADVDQVIGAASLDWVHLAVTYDGTTATAYYNGILAATFTPATDDLTFNKWAIGVNRGENNWFDGSIDELRVYDIALTPEEIAWLGGRTAPFDEPF
ncbi:MAG: discoidin domain-containing protein, partial [Phycisphaerales bacterium]